jgi:predicted metal-dependent HD superfamily phosphohydrolase
MLYTHIEIDQVLQDSGLPGLLTPEILCGVQDRYDEDGRVYHDFDHAIQVLSWVNHIIPHHPEDTLAPCTHTALRVAALFHDVVYDQEGTPSNEQRSAELMLNLLRPLGKFSEQDLEQAHDLILVTAKHGKLTASDVTLGQALMLDCDISNLGERWEIFYSNNLNVVKELRLKYNEEEIKVGRKAFLGGMLSNPSIYMSKWFQDRFEDQARSNIQRALEQV